MTLTDDLAELQSAITTLLTTNGIEVVTNDPYNPPTGTQFVIIDSEYTTPIQFTKHDLRQAVAAITLDVYDDDHYRMERTYRQIKALLGSIRRNDPAYRKWERSEVKSRYLTTHHLITAYFKNRNVPAWSTTTDVIDYSTQSRRSLKPT